MAKNQYSSHGEGRYITVAKASVSSGDPVIIGDEGLHGFSLIDTDGSGNIVVDTAGIYTFPVKGNNGSIDTAVAIGDAVFFTAGEAFFDVDPTAAFFGYALDAVDSGDTDTIRVLVVQKSDIVSGTVNTVDITDGAVTPIKVSGLGNVEAYAKTATGVNTLLAEADKARAALILVKVTETFADGDGSATVFKIGDETDDDKFLTKNTGTAGDIVIVGGEVTSGDKVIVTATAATGTGTGAIQVTAIAV
ncbi:MAG: hypothetical protein WDA59_04030 [Methanofastidiosum sp.]